MYSIRDTEQLERKVAAYCDLRLKPILTSHEAESLQSHLLSLVALQRHPKRKGQSYDWAAFADACKIDRNRIAEFKVVI